MPPKGRSSLAYATSPPPVTFGPYADLAREFKPLRAFFDWEPEQQAAAKQSHLIRNPSLLRDDPVATHMLILAARIYQAVERPDYMYDVCKAWLPILRNIPKQLDQFGYPSYFPTHSAVSAGGELYDNLSIPDAPLAYRETLNRWDLIARGEDEGPYIGLLPPPTLTTSSTAIDKAPEPAMVPATSTARTTPNTANVQELSAESGDEDAEGETDLEESERQEETPPPKLSKKPAPAATKPAKSKAATKAPAKAAANTKAVKTVKPSLEATVDKVPATTKRTRPVVDFTSRPDLVARANCKVMPSEEGEPPVPEPKKVGIRKRAATSPAPGVTSVKRVKTANKVKGKAAIKPSAPEAMSFETYSTSDLVKTPPVSNTAQPFLPTVDADPSQALPGPADTASGTAAVKHEHLRTGAVHRGASVVDNNIASHHAGNASASDGTPVEHVRARSRSIPITPFVADITTISSEVLSALQDPARKNAVRELLSKHTWPADQVDPRAANISVKDMEVPDFRAMSTLCLNRLGVRLRGYQKPEYYGRGVGCSFCFDKTHKERCLCTYSPEELVILPEQLRSFADIDTHSAKARVRRLTYYWNQAKDLEDTILNMVKVFDSLRAQAMLEYNDFACWAHRVHAHFTPGVESFFFRDAKSLEDFLKKSPQELIDQVVAAAESAAFSKAVADEANAAATLFREPPMVLAQAPDVKVEIGLCM